MLKQIASSLIGLVVITTILLIGINIVFTYPYFEHFGIHTATLDLLYGNITPEELRKTNINGWFLVPKEIAHLQDVVTLVKYSRIALIGLVPASLILLFTWKPLRISATIRAWTWALFTFGVLGTAYAIGGTRIISQIIHPIFFPQGNWMFDKNSLIRKIYSQSVMETGATSVMAITAALLILLTVLAIWRDSRDIGNS